MPAIVTGHKNPDSDSILSAIAAADFFSKRGIESQPYAQGKPVPETMFILEKFGLSTPKEIKSVTGKDVILVDHSDLAQAPEGLDSSNLLAIVDHHKLGDITTTTPLTMWIQPVGCTSTVLKLMYDFYGIEIPKSIAGAMLCAILSDTVIFKSPTTTEEDKKAVRSLARIAGIEDYSALGMEMFTVKSAIGGTSAKELLFRDYKEFSMNGKKIGVGQLEVIDISMLDSIKNDLIQEINNVKKEGVHSVFLLLTDIMKEGSELLSCTDDKASVEKVFNITYAECVWLPGVMSRKKDVIPKFEAIFKN